MVSIYWGNTDVNTRGNILESGFLWIAEWTWGCLGKVTINFLDYSFSSI